MEDLKTWITIAKMRKDDPLFSRLRNGRSRSLRRKDVSEIIKEAARHFNLQPLRFTPHSLRIGGAATLLAAGVSREEVQRVAGWSGSPGTDVKSYGRGTRLDRGALAVAKPLQLLDTTHVVAEQIISTADAVWGADEDSDF